MTRPRGDMDGSDLDLRRAYEPIVRLTGREFFLPTSVDDYVASCEPLQHVPNGRP